MSGDASGTELDAVAQPGMDPTNTSMQPQGAADRRPRMFEPPPVRLLTVRDAEVIAPAGVETQLDDFYMSLLQFQREVDSEFPVYRAENFRLFVQVLEPPIHRQDMRPLGIQVPSLGELEQRLTDREIEYVRRRGLLPAQECLALLDPAGNWIEITESREVR